MRARETYTHARSTQHSRVAGLALLALLVVFGCVLRALKFASREAFWSDEAALALNIVDRSWSELGRPFVHAQVAPYAYAATQKLIVSVAGVSEESLRAWSLLAGIAFLPALYALARKLADARAGLFAVAAAATTSLLVYYSTELKPYATDALVTTLLALATARGLLAETPEKHRTALWQLAITGVVGPWLSLPAVFVLAAIGCTLAIAARLECRPLRHWLALAAIGGGWIASFALHYASFLQLEPDDAAFMERYWYGVDGFAPWPPRTFAELRWYAGKFFYLFAVLVSSVGHGERYVAAGLWVVGLLLLWRKHRALPALAVLPIVFMFAASAAHAYVVVDRLTLFLTPLLLVPCALGLSWLAQLRPPLSNFAVVSVIAALAGEHTLQIADALRQPRLPSDIRTLVLDLRDRAGDRDPVCVEDRVAWIYEYYARRAGAWRPIEVVQVLEPDAQRARVELSKVRKLAGAPRVWLVVPTLGPIGPAFADGVEAVVAAEQRMLEQFRRLGRRVAVFDATNVRLYLYDLSQSASISP